jgi:hypothetical protein
VSFIFADLIILPIVLIYRKYYGGRMALRITGIFYLAMVCAGYVVELVFAPLGLIPTTRHALVTDTAISWNYTTYLNIVFGVIAMLLVTRFVRSGGTAMLKMMGGHPDGAPQNAGAPGHTQN